VRGVQRLEREAIVPRPVDEVFAFFAEARNLERITPPWLGFTLLTPEPIEMRRGTLIEYRLTLHHLPIRWLTRIEEWQENRWFVDRQVRGPYRVWHHRHEFEVVSEGTLVRDLVHYAIPLGPIGRAAQVAFVRRDLARIFDFRQAAVVRLLAAV
jgi:hypothetical protein